MWKQFFIQENLINELFIELETASKSYQSLTKLDCLNGCGKCCNSPEVEASPLEMLPLALDLWREGSAEKWLERLEELVPASCIFYEKHNPDGSQGKCSVYKKRPILCRSFAVNGYMNKYSQKVLSVCKEIKQDKSEQWMEIKTNQQLIDQAPLPANWTRQIQNINSTLSHHPRPINKAILEALKTVLFHADLENQKER